MRIKKKGWQGQLSCVCPEYVCSGQDLYEVHEIQTDYKYKNRAYICVRVRNPLQRFRHLCTAQAQTSYITRLYMHMFRIQHSATELMY